MVRSVRRKQSSITPSSKGSKAGKSWQDGNELCCLVSQHGFIFSTQEGQPNEITVDQVIFQKGLSSALKSANDQRILTLKDGLLDIWKDNTRFCFSLLPTMSAYTCDASSRGKQQESFVRLLLGVSKLQTVVAVCLLEKLAEVSADEPLQTTAQQLGDINLHQRIVNQLRWLECVHDSQTVLEKVFEIVSISPIEVQQEIISCIPDCIDEKNHIHVAKRLQTMLQGDSQLTSSLMEALASMNLPSDLVTEVRESALEILNSADVSNISGVVKFLQQTSTEGSVLQIVEEIRDKVDFISSFPCFSSTPVHRRKEENRDNLHGEEIFNSIKSGMRFQKPLIEAWLKVLEKVNKAEDQKVLDVYIILLLVNLKSKRRQLERLMRHKIKSAVFTEKTIALAFQSYTNVFEDMLEEIMQLAETFFRSPDNIVCNYGVQLYLQAFIHFQHTSRQKLVGALISHVGSCFANEVKYSIDVLTNLVNNHLTLVETYTTTIKEVLQYAGQMCVIHMRSMFYMFCKLAFNNNNSCEQELHNEIGSYLAGGSMLEKRVGVLAVMGVVNTLGDKQAQPEALLKVKDYLTMARENIASLAPATSLFFDELAAVVLTSKLHRQLLEWIADKIFQEFQDYYLVDTDNFHSSKKMELCYDLDETEEGGIGVNILPLLVSPQHSKKKLICLPTHIRLVQSCEKVQNSNLEGIDALLGCPLVLFGNTVLDTFTTMNEQDRMIVCSSLVHAVNWLREVLNAFTLKSVEAEMRAKVLARLHTLVELTRTLEKYLAITHNFQLPVVDYTIDDSLLSSLKTIKSLADSKLFKKPGAKKSKPNKTANSTTILADDNTTIDKENIEDEIEDIKNSIGLHHFPASFRQLDINVFYVLSYDVASKSVLDTDENTKENVEYRLTTEDIIFLLKDLQSKLEHSLNGASKRMFLKQPLTKMIGFSHLPLSKDVMLVCTHVFPALVVILNNCQQHFKKVVEDNDGVLDCKDLYSETSKQTSIVYRLLLNCFLAIFQWDGFESEENKEVLLSLFRYISDSTGEFDECLGEALERLIASSGSIHNIQLACTLTKVVHTVSKWKQHVQSLRDMVEGFLSRSWYNREGDTEKGQVFNECLSYLIRLRVTLSDTPLETIEETCERLLDDDQSTFPCLIKSAVPSCYKCIFEEGNIIFKQIISHKKSTAEFLEDVEKSVKVFNLLVDTAKNSEVKALLTATLKNARVYLDTFLKQTMPTLEQSLPTQKDLVHGILKSVQQSTRSLQHICAHTKCSKDLSLTTSVPALKKCLETFVFRVKALLAYHNCDGAFWLGNLKNRDLKGNEILSQAESTISNEEESDCSVPEEDEELEEHSESF